jgi:hypothetical protein
MSPRRVSVEAHIEELVLHGFHPGDRLHVAEALQRELTRLLRDPRTALPARRVEVESAEAAPIVIRPGATPAAIGRQVAGAIHQRLTRWGTLA